MANPFETLKIFRYLISFRREMKFRHEAFVNVNFLSTLSLVLYSFFSIVTVLMNRQLLKRGFSHPVILTWFQQLLTLILVSTVKFQTKSHAFNFSVWVQGLPTALAFMGMVLFSNICLKFSSVPSYQVARSTTIFFNILLSFCLIKKTTTHLSIVACCITCFGFVLGKLDPLFLSWESCASGILSSFFQSLYSIFVKSFCCGNIQEKQIQILHATALTCSVALVPFLWYSGELPVLLSIVPYDWTSLKYFGSVVLCGFSGILVTFCTVLAVNLTSPLSYCMTGYAKSALQSFVGIVLFKEYCPLHSFIGLLLTLLGCCMYSVSMLKA